jgi:hypothetical protein
MSWRDPSVLWMDISYVFRLGLRLSWDAHAWLLVSRRRKLVPVAALPLNRCKFKNPGSNTILLGYKGNIVGASRPQCWKEFAHTHKVHAMQNQSCRHYSEINFDLQPRKTVIFRLPLLIDDINKHPSPFCTLWAFFSMKKLDFDTSIHGRRINYA